MRDSADLFGWTGRLLHVDLNRGRCETRSLAPEVLRAWLGGRGLGGYLLRPTCTLAWDDPEMPVCICAGPLAGSGSPASGRAHFTSRSPRSPAMGDAPAGGRLGTQLKRAGWDAVVISGKGARPCGLEITNQEARIVPTPELSGLRTGEVFARLARFGSVACVGPAAERGSALACIAVDRHHAAGRTGLGLSLAVKNLKYLAVSGSGRVRVANKAALLRARGDVIRLTNASPVLLGQQGLARFGTAALSDLMDARRMMPTDNFQRTHFAHASELNAFALRRRYQPESHGCTGCHVRCGKAASGAALPEFDALSHFTALINNGDLECAVRANALCGDLGLDAVASASALACLRETRGRDFGPGEVEALLEDMGAGHGGPGQDALAQGTLAQGADAVAAKAGRPETAMTVKGLELGACDPRGAYGLALALAVATRGGCAQRAATMSHEILRKPVATDRFSFSGKARMIKLAEDQIAATDSLAVCGYFFFAASLEEYARLYTAVTGLTGPESTAQGLMRAGERIVRNERTMNALNGVTAQDDDLPQRFFTQAGTGGEGIEVPPLDRAAFLEARTRYYRIRGLDETGLPAWENPEEPGAECDDS
ncbi:MAG: aldehyde ferredoxin oxidoreductase C-terminal domain-containing protein [Desulfovibrio sp.]